MVDFIMFSPWLDLTILSNLGLDGLLQPRSLHDSTNPIASQSRQQTWGLQQCPLLHRDPPKPPHQQME